MFPLVCEKCSFASVFITSSYLPVASEVEDEDEDVETTSGMLNVLR